MRKQQAEIQLKLGRQIQRAQEEAELARREAEEEKRRLDRLKTKLLVWQRRRQSLRTLKLTPKA